MIHTDNMKRVVIRKVLEIQITVVMLKVFYIQIISLITLVAQWLLILTIIMDITIVGAEKIIEYNL